MSEATPTKEFPWWTIPVGIISLYTILFLILMFAIKECRSAENSAELDKCRKDLYWLLVTTVIFCNLGLVIVLASTKLEHPFVIGSFLVIVSALLPFHKMMEELVVK